MMDLWNKDAEDSLRKLGNIFLTEDGNTDFSFSSEEDDPNAEVKNALKKKRLYLLAFAFFPAFSGIIGLIETGLLYFFHIPVYGRSAMLVRYIAAFLGTIAAIRGIRKWRGESRGAKASGYSSFLNCLVHSWMFGNILVSLCICCTIKFTFSSMGFVPSILIIGQRRD